VSATAVEKYGSAHTGCTVADGELVLHLSGGMPPYSIHINGRLERRDGQTAYQNPAQTAAGDYYRWMSTMDTVAVLDSLGAGRYSINVNDMGGCHHWTEVEVRSPGQLRLSTEPLVHPNGYYVSCDTCADASLTATAAGAYGAVEFVWVQMPESEAPLRIKGASLFLSEMGGSGDAGWMFDPGNPYVVATGPQATGLEPEVFHALGARDALGCMGQKFFSLERPGPGGPEGPAGADGATGPTGPQGEPGNDGADGATGPTGPQGEPGNDGADGATGATGPQGERGDDGADGATGPQGIAGATGAPGPQGEQGNDGATGPQGIAGATGPQGERGDDGADGATGPTGPQGPAGQDGVEPAPAWRLGGNSGENNWLGTSDNTDLVMKANGQTLLKLGADGVTEVTGPFKLSGLPGTPHPCEIITRGPDGIITATIGPCPPPAECVEPVIPWSLAPDGNPENIALCNSYKKVGIGYLNPEYQLHVGGTGYFTQRLIVSEPNPVLGIALQVGGTAHINRLRVNTGTGSAELTVKGGSSQSGRALDVQDMDGEPALQVFNDGLVRIRNGQYEEAGHRASIELGDFNSVISGVHSKGLSFSTWNAQDAMVIAPGGKVSIGGVNEGPHSDYLLGVKGKILAKEVLVTLDHWSDFVFDRDYRLRPLSEVEAHIRAHGHLPDVPSAAEVMEKGNNLGEMDAILLRKIEELTLYMLDMDRRMKELEQENRQLKMK